MNKKTLRLLIIAVALFVALTQLLYERQQQKRPSGPPQPVQAEVPAAALVQEPVAQQSPGDTIIANAYATHRSNIQVEAEGTVQRLLADDNSGSRHQRFILQLSGGQTLLVAHNIDLAPRISGLQAGDVVHFFGEYEWSSQGGVIHWTHRDPGGRHAAGWLQHGGRVYQ